jgi:hypothetical protein
MELMGLEMAAAKYLFVLRMTREDLQVVIAEVPLRLPGRRPIFASPLNFLL